MSEHIVSRKIYFLVFGALMVLRILTVIAANINFGGVLNDIIAMTIAVTKAVLVILFFMHVRYGSRLIMIVVVAGFFWLGIMLALTMSDYQSRRWLDPPLRQATIPAEAHK